MHAHTVRERTTRKQYLFYGLHGLVEALKRNEIHLHFSGFELDLDSWNIKKENVQNLNRNDWTLCLKLVSYWKMF